MEFDDSGTNYSDKNECTYIIGYNFLCFIVHVDNNVPPFIFIDKFNVQLYLQNLKNVNILYVNFINDFFIHKKSFFISKIFHFPILWRHFLLFGMPLLMFIFGKSFPSSRKWRVRKLEGKESMHMLLTWNGSTPDNLQSYNRRYK